MRTVAFGIGPGSVRADAAGDGAPGAQRHPHCGLVRGLNLCYRVSFKSLKLRRIAVVRKTPGGLQTTAMRRSGRGAPCKL